MVIIYVLRERVPTETLLRIAIVVTILLLGSSRLISNRQAKQARRLTDLGLPTGDFPIEVQVEVHVAAALEPARVAILEALRSLPNVIAKTVRSKNEREIRARTAWSRISTLGELIEVKMSSVDSGIIVAISSRPVLWTTFIDSGLNYQNVALVLRCLAASHPLTVRSANAPFEGILN